MDNHWIIGLKTIGPLDLRKNSSRWEPFYNKKRLQK